MWKIILALCFSFVTGINSIYAQQVVVDVADAPLNEVLTGIRDAYNVQISFDDHFLSTYKISSDSTFSNPAQVLKYLIKGLPLELEKNGEVFVIYFVQPTKKKIEYTFSGQIKDSKSGELLPFSHISINGQTLATDLLGSFNYKSFSDSIFTVRASHLGYYILDTVYPSTSKVDILLVPSSIGLKEVVISNALIEKSTMIGNKAGLMKLNHKVAFFLPGFGDNSVFNLLRLMPGILASGESTNDLVIWGSYAGQSLVLFDGFTIFGLKNFNDNISSFNPLMAKDIEILKGGFDARYGERVGGIVNITGKNGNLEQPSFSVSLNNMTLNGIVEIPIAKKATIVFSLRHTYYNLYNPADINSVFKRNTDNDSTNDINVVPDYVFRDANLKYTQQIGENGLFYISLYGGGDKFSYNLNEPIKLVTITKNTSETNSQLGGTLFYGKTYRNGNTSNFNISYSGLVTKYADQYQVINTVNEKIHNKRQLDSKNLVDEFVAKVDNRFTLGSKNTLEVSGGFYVNQVELLDDTFGINLVDIKEKARRVYSMVQDNIALGKKAVLKVGSRFTYASNLKKMYIEPRVSVSVQANDYWKFNAAWGIYNQFITQSSIIDELGNYRYLWVICNNEDIPVVQASHFVLGASFHKKGWTFSVEPYFKKVEGITRYFYSERFNWEGILVGNSKLYGIDFFLQKDWKGHSAWVAYSLGKVEEQWPSLPNNDYRRAPQDQRHEVKLALLLNFDPFYFSTNYVYGSGFPVAPYNPKKNDDALAYSRLDVSFIYKFLDRKVVGEVGISILNMLNTNNIKYANFVRIPNNQTNTINIYSEAIPFTPTLYLKFSM